MAIESLAWGETYTMLITQQEIVCDPFIRNMTAAKVLSSVKFRAKH